MRSNQEWAVDFASDALATGRGIRILAIVDAFTRECLTLEVDTSLSSQRVTPNANIPSQVMIAYPMAAVAKSNGTSLPRQTSSHHAKIQKRTTAGQTPRYDG